MINDKSNKYLKHIILVAPKRSIMPLSGSSVYITDPLIKHFIRDLNWFVSKRIRANNLRANITTYTESINDKYIQLIAAMIIKMYRSYTHHA